MMGNKNSEVIPETFTALAEMYVKEMPLRPASRTTYLKVANTFDRDQNSPPVANIDRQVLLNWRSMVVECASTRTWNNYHAHFRAVWLWALKRGLAAHNPLDGGKWVMPAPKPLPKTVSHHLLRKALGLLEGSEDTCPPGWFWAKVVRILYFTAMRRRQLVELRWNDIDLGKRLLRLRCEGSKNNREYWIPLHRECIHDLVDLRKQVCRQLGRGPEPRDQTFNITLFNSLYAGRIMTEDQVSGFFRRLSGHLDDTISAHRLRHTFATSLANLPDSNLKSVQEMLGHTDIRTTMIYVHPDIEAQRRLLQSLPSLDLVLTKKGETQS